MAGGVPSGRGHKLKAEINVTPLVDVVLVLLIIFMVVTPMLSHGGDVELPMATAADGESHTSDAIVLTIASDKTLWVEDQRVAHKALGAALGRRLAATPGREVLIKADANVSVRDLRPVLQELKALQVGQIAFAVLEHRGAE